MLTGAYPYRRDVDRQRLAAAWAQHLLVRRLRIWLPLIGVRTTNDWIRTRRLTSKRTSWFNMFKGDRWAGLSDIAFILEQAPDADANSEAIEELGQALKGDSFPEDEESTVPSTQMTRGEAGIRVSRERGGRAAKAGVSSGPVDAVDSIWWSLDTLAAENNVESPATLIAYERDGLYAANAITGGTAVVTLPNPNGLPLPLVGSHAILSGSVTPGEQVLALTFADTADDGPAFVSLPAVVTGDGRLNFLT